MSAVASAAWPFGRPDYANCLVVAFTGRTGAGKDSAAKALADVHNFQTIAFADALRREISAAWRIDERMLTHRPTKELPLPSTEKSRPASTPSPKVSKLRSTPSRTLSLVT